MDQWVNGINYVEGSAFSLKVLTLVVTCSSDSSKGAFWANLSRACVRKLLAQGGGPV